MMYFIAIQHTYQQVEFALFQNDTCIEIVRESKLQAAALFTIHIDSLLKTANRTLQQLSCIGVNQGPGPFTTLRVVLSCVNGIGFSKQIPLIGISGMDALLDEYASPSYPYLVALLNAFHNDVYVGIQHQSGRLLDCMSISDLITHIKKELPHGVTPYFIGNGTTLHRTLLEESFDAIMIENNIVEGCSIEQLGTSIYQQLLSGEIGTAQIMPIYGKEQLFQTIRH